MTRECFAMPLNRRYAGPFGAIANVVLTPPDMHLYTTPGVRQDDRTHRQGASPDAPGY